MRESGAEVMPCPHCESETPVYESEYSSSGDPVSFSVCLWCGGLVEYSDATNRAHVPYEGEVQTDRKRSNL